MNNTLKTLVLLILLAISVVLQGFLGAPEFANLAEEYGIKVN